MAYQRNQGRAAEGVAFTRTEMGQLLSQADKGIRELISAQAGALAQPLIKA
jgi:ribonuclease PH